MKNSTAPNRKTGRMIAKNLIVLFTVALAAFYGIQAWFTDKQSSDADGINIECHAPDGIEIAVVKHGDPAPTDDAAYKNTIELNSENYSFIDDIKMTISITIECEDLTIESKEHQFHQLVERAITFGFSKSHDREAMCVNFVFPSVLDKSM